jgi:hypothetical protein
MDRKKCSAPRTRTLSEDMPKTVRRAQDFAATFEHASTEKTTWHMTKIPEQSDFPPGTEFVIYEFDVPLARVPQGAAGEARAWFNWYGGKPRPYAVERLKVDNNWPADSFEQWAALVKASLR